MHSTGKAPIYCRVRNCWSRATGRGSFPGRCQFHGVTCTNQAGQTLEPEAAA